MAIVKILLIKNSMIHNDNMDYNVNNKNDNNDKSNSRN